MEIKNLGSEAILLQWSTIIDIGINREVHLLNEAILEQEVPGIKYTIPAYASLCVSFDPGKISKQTLIDLIHQIKSNLKLQLDPNITKIKIPVCYAPTFGLDLHLLSEQLQLSISEMVELHSRKKYQVYLIGFMMGFPYLGSVVPALQAPRKKTPRKFVPEGSIGIAGAQTGIYPSSAPGGWQIIGRTPVKIFDIHKAFPFEIEAGDEIEFYPITEGKFYEIQKDQKEGKYEIEYEK